MCVGLTVKHVISTVAVYKAVSVKQSSGICPSVRPSVCLSLCASVCPSVCLSHRTNTQSDSRGAVTTLLGYIWALLREQWRSQDIVKGDSQWAKPPEARDNSQKIVLKKA